MEIIKHGKTYEVPQVKVCPNCECEFSYVKKDMVTMRTGGVSTRNVRNRLLITQEDVKACRKHGLYTNVLFVSLKYFCKIFELRIV